MYVSKKVLATALVSALSLGGAAFAQTGDMGNSPATPQSSQSPMGAMGTHHMNKASSKDMAFARKASAGNMAEVETAKLASSRAQSQAVKDFATTMINDHSEAETKLKAVASAQNMDIPSSPTAKQQTAMDKLKGLNGAAFDKAYSKHMLKDHKKDVADYKKESKNAKDDSLKSYATETLPTLEHHLEMAKQLPDNGGKSMMSGKSSSSGN